jgi:hypothetical protein
MIEHIEIFIKKNTEEVFSGTLINDIILKFQQNFKSIGDKIDRRNSKRLIKYSYFHPNLITNSISV